MDEKIIYKIENTKRIKTLPNTDLITIKFLSNYFEVQEDTIKKIIRRHKKELQNNGMKLYKKTEILDLIQSPQSEEIENIASKIPNRGMNLFPKKCILIFVLLLEDNEVADKIQEELGLLTIKRKEIMFLNKLEEVLKPFNITGIRQYRIFNYRIDYYIPELNIAIEYDENEHKGYSYEAHKGRQKEIENKLGCKFIRVTDKESDEYNIGLVIKEIFNINI